MMRRSIGTRSAIKHAELSFLDKAQAAAQNPNLEHTLHDGRSGTVASTVAIKKMQAAKLA